MANYLDQAGLQTFFSKLKSVFVSKAPTNILVIGNSYSLDAFQYTPAIFKSLGIDVNIVQFYKGGNTKWQISTYRSIIENDTAFCSIYSYFNGSTNWSVTKSSNGKFSDVTNIMPNFDIVVINQYSVANVSASDTVTSAQDLVNYLKSRSESSKAKFGFLASPAYANGYSGLSTVGYANSQEMWAAQVEVNLKASISTFDFIIPSNTAIENARTNSTLDALGTFTHLTYDGQHLQEGLPCLISALTAVYTIMLSSGLSPKAVTNVRPTDQWITDQAINGTHGSSVGVTESNVSLAYNCVVAAINQPFNLTTINSTGGVYSDFLVDTSRSQIINGVKNFLNGLLIGGNKLEMVSGTLVATVDDFQVDGTGNKLRRIYGSNARIVGLSVYGTSFNETGSNYPRILARLEKSGTVTETTSVALKDAEIDFALNRTTKFGIISADSNLDKDWNTKEIPTKNAVAIRTGIDVLGITTSNLSTYYDSTTKFITFQSDKQEVMISIGEDNGQPVITELNGVVTGGPVGQRLYITIDTNTPPTFGSVKGTPGTFPDWISGFLTQLSNTRGFRYSYLEFIKFNDMWYSKSYS